MVVVAGFGLKSSVRSRLGFWLRQEKMDIVPYIQYNYCIYIYAYTYKG